MHIRYLGKGWAFFTTQTMDTYENVSAVGTLMYGESNLITEAGAIVWNDGSPYIVARHTQSLEPMLRVLRPVDYSSAAAILVKKDVFRQV